ncbi:helix-turn-helix domain-containing protein [Sessilibacter corallicola]|uniref:helix-turn-helix domain-containing protein n=1 Tax=Sessilibacter corallicola TaxID=2904075 RepID=UPI003312FD38
MGHYSRRMEPGNRGCAKRKKAVIFERGRELLSLSQPELAKELGWSSKQVSNIETRSRPLQKQTLLAIECLLRRKGLWNKINTQGS